MATTNTVEAPGTGLLDWLRAISRPSLLALGVGVLAVLSAMVTYGMVTGLIPYNPTPSNLVALLLINLALGVSLAGLIAWRLVRLWRERRSGLAGARLHVRLVAMFSLIAVVPAILVAIFATVTLNLGIEAWFSARVQTALDNAVGVARQYMIEQGRHILYDAGEIETGIEHDRALFDENKQVRLSMMIEKIAIMTTDRGLAGSFLIDSHGSELAKSAKLSYSTALKPSTSDIADARAGRIVVDGDPETGYIHALIYLPFLKDAYLLVVRHVDPKVFGYYHRTKAAVSEYDRLNQSRSQVQLIFAALYIVVSLVILLSAIWLGLWAANRLVRPISSLIGAAERVSEGDLKAQVEVERDDDEVGLLGRAFNRMTGQLDAQRSALISANRQNDERRRFTEAVLAGVSAGVIGIDSNGAITIVNRAAARLLNVVPDEIEGRDYAEAVPELAALIRRAITEPVGRSSGEVTVKRGMTSRSLSVQVSSERGADGSGFVATFDDITDLVSAQRTAAWGDIARRIAHEIKNPLTPIQLSAERLRRKYSGEITTDPDVFNQCTETIIRQVGDIGRMVDEFSSFARMPAPVMRRENAQELIQQAVFLQRVAHSQIAFEIRAPKDPIFLECDGRLVAQALTNVLKNAGEAIGARIAKGDSAPGRIVIALACDEGVVSFKIADNGVGLPHEQRDRLTEPYVTTRAKGTGLGLAIVRKVMEDHGGDITLRDADKDIGGAEIVLRFPSRQKKVKEKGPGDEQARIADRV
ncbi:MAG TPA: PAS domain-containing sensor histidine kinase [Rhizomicrobium sp.]|jgi:two-component system nitrogen regulation sensor histidine kinase NtrY